MAWYWWLLIIGSGALGLFGLGWLIVWAYIGRQFEKGMREGFGRM